MLNKLYLRWQARRALSRDLKKAGEAFATEVLDKLSAVTPEELEKYRSIPWGPTTGWAERSRTGPFLPTHDEQGKPIEWSGAANEADHAPEKLTRWMKNG